MKLSVVGLDDPVHCEYIMWGPSMGHLLSPPNYTGNLDIEISEEKRRVALKTLQK